MTAAARAEIELGAIQKNLQVIREVADGAKLMAVVKANAYGHGIAEVAGAIPDADSLAVARVNEARQLRDAGIESAIVVLNGAFSIAELKDAAAMNLAVCIHNAEQMEWFEQSPVPPMQVWLKVDTGMNRLGVRPPDAASMIGKLQQSEKVASLGLMTHLANADDALDPATPDQIRLFAEIAEGFNGELSFANSAGIFSLPSLPPVISDALNEKRLWCRPGLSLYGISPFRDKSASSLGLLPAMTFRSSLIAVKALPSGSRVGYGGTWQSDKDTTLGIVAAGYGDGYSRHIESGTPVLLNGRRVLVAGRVSMDSVAVDLGPGASDRVGDVVTMWGDGLPVEEIAAHANSIPYTLVTGVTARVERNHSN